MSKFKVKKASKTIALAIGITAFAPSIPTLYGLYKHHTDHRGMAHELKNLIVGLEAISSSRAEVPTYTQSVTNLLRNAIGTAIGYSDKGYLDFVCRGNATAQANGTCTNGPPQKGIVGVTVPVANAFKTIAQNAGIATCSAVPASGTSTANDASGTAQTITWQTPTHTVPANWVGGGVAFQKRAKMSSSVTIGGEATPIVVAMEFNCDTSGASYMAVTMDVSTTQLPGFKRNIAVFTGNVNSTTGAFDVYYTEGVPTGTTTSAGVVGPVIRGGLGMKIEYVPGTSTFNLWTTFINSIQNANGGLGVTAHAIASGNYATTQASVYFSGVEETQIGSTTGQVNIAQLVADQPTSAAEDGVGTATDYSLAAELTTGSSPTMASGALIKKQGCITFESPTTGPTSATLCSGFALSAPSSAPAIDATGKFSQDWLLKTLMTKLETVQ